MNAPAILPEDERSNARRAFIKFQRNLEWLEDAMNPFVLQMSPECRFELQMLGVTARSFFKMANAEIFSKASVEQVNLTSERR